MRRSAAALVLALMLPLPSFAGEVVVKPGETLSEIAERYGTTVQRLMQLNGLRDAKDLWAGSTIRVPATSRSSSGAAGSVARGSQGSYTVKPGETLSEIAERYGTTVQRLMQLNGLREANDLWAGSTIRVPASARSSSAAAVNRKATQHRVQPGQTLSEIADLYGVPMQRLISLNGLSQPDQLLAGSTLKLRSATAASKPAAKPARKPAATAAAKPATKPVAQAPKPTPKPAVIAAAPMRQPAAPAVQPAAAPATAAPAPVATAKPVSTAQTSPQPASSAAAAKPAPVSKPASTAKPVASARPSKPSTPDWRSYGPLQVDWANWQPMGGSYVAPSLNSDGQPLYLAVNCNARRLNATGQSGTWKTWDAPQSDFEQQLITDLCKAKQS